MINQSLEKTQTAKLHVYQKPYPLELIFFVVPHRQRANFSLRRATNSTGITLHQSITASIPRPERARSTNSAVVVRALLV